MRSIHPRCSPDASLSNPGTRLGFTLFAGSLLVLVLAAPAFSSTPGDLTLEELTDQANLILHGDIESVTGAWNSQNTQIFSDIDFSIIEQIKGSLSVDRITIRHLGGTAENTRLVITESPQFIDGEEVIIFYTPGVIPFTGGTQGKFTVILVPSSGEKIIEENGMELQEFIDQIKALL